MESPSFLSPYQTSGTVSSSDYNSDYNNDMYGSRNNNATNESQRKSSKKTVSTFIQKLYSMLENNTHGDLITWSPSGTSFSVCNAKVFAAQVLPTHFKHSNFSSFVRLLNMYGFHKISKSTRNQRSNDNEVWEFSHAKFIRGRPDLLKDIKRKTMDSEMMRRETSDIQASFAMLQMSQADLIQQFSTLQENFATLLSGLEESRKVQQQQADQIRQLSEQQGLGHVNNIPSNIAKWNQNVATDFNGQGNLLANQLSPSSAQPRHRRTISTPSLPSNESLQQYQYQYQPEGTRLGEPFKMMVTTPPSSNNHGSTNQMNCLDDTAYWMNKSMRSFSQPPEIQRNTNNDDTNNTKLPPTIQQQPNEPNVLFSPMTFQSAVNTPLPPSPMMLANPDLAMSPGTSEDSLGSYAFNLGQVNTIDPTFM